jgi:hypothetical protein
MSAMNLEKGEYLAMAILRRCRFQQARSVHLSIGLNRAEFRFRNVSWRSSGCPFRKRDFTGVMAERKLER